MNKYNLLSDILYKEDYNEYENVEWDMEEYIENILLPEKMKKLKFSDTFNSKISLIRGNKLEYLVIGNGYKGEIDFVGEGIRYLSVGDRVKEVNELPESLEYLSLGNSCITRLDNKLPINLKTLRLGRNYIYKISGLPENLVYLELGLYYNRELDELPNNLKYLVINTNFDKELDRLPISLKAITFKDYTYFNRELDLRYLVNLRKIRLGEYFDKELDKLPEGIENIEFCSKSRFSYNLDKLPEGVKKIMLGDNYNGDLNELPNSVEEIYLGTFYNTKIERWPKNIKKVIFSKNSYYKYEIDNDDIEIIKN